MADKTLLIKLKIAADGAAAATVVGQLGNVGSAERRLGTEISATNRAADAQKAAFGGVTSSLTRMLAAIGATAAVAGLLKKTFDYNQDLEATKNGIAGLLNANQNYIDSQGRAVSATVSWTAANAEATGLMAKLQTASLKTAATVPQIADAFELVYGALKQAGQSTQDLNPLVDLTTRLTQTANAFHVPMEQMRQEINSLMTGQITQDSTIAHRLGLTNADVKAMQANGTLVAELIKRTEAYAVAADAQANTVRGKIINTTEAVIASFARGFDPVIQRMKGGLDGIFDLFTKNGDSITRWIRIGIGAFDAGSTAVTNFVKAHRELLTDIASVAAIAGVAAAGYLLVAGAIAVISSPITLTIAGIVALAFLWEKARKWSAIEIAGVPIAGYLRATFGILQTTLSTFVNAIVGAGRVIFNALEAIFGSIATAIIAPFATAVHMASAVLSMLPKIVSDRIPGFDQIVAATKTVDEFLSKWQAKATGTAGSGYRGMRDSVVDTFQTQVEVFRQGMDKVGAGIGSTTPLAGPSDIVAAAWEAAKSKLSAMLPDLQKIGEKAIDALMPGGVHSGGGGKRKLTEAQQKQLTDFDTWIKELSIRASAAGSDPIAEKIAAIEAQRVKARADAIEKAKASLGAIGDDRVKLAGSLADKIAGNETFQLLNEKTLENVKRILKLRSELELDAQKDLDDDRINLIDDALQRELEQNRAANRQWVADKRTSISEFYDEQIKAAQRTLAALEAINAPWAKKAAKEQQTVIDALLQQETQELDAVDADKERRDKRSADLYKQHLAEQTAGTVEWAKKTRQAILDQFGNINQIITSAVMETRSALAGAINGFLDDLTSGQASAAKSIEGLGRGVAQVWNKQLTSILVNGGNVMSQLQALWRNLNTSGNPAAGGSTVNAAINGAGIGSMIGGVFGKPNNYGALGGTVGGAIGAVIGSYFANTALGAVIGSAIGTAVGSLIQKGKDQINVSIRNATLASLGGVGDFKILPDMTSDGTISVDEKGISRETRNDVFVQIRRKVKETMKGWQGIIDLFPDYVKDQLALLKITPTLNLTGGVTDGDIRDEQALQSLSDFLGNKLPKAGFEAYTEALKKAFSILGVGQIRINEMFRYFGTMQGEELQSAVKGFVTTMVEGVHWRDVFKDPFSTRETSALKPTTMFAQLDDVQSKIALTVASMTKLTDVEDLVAAQKTLNGLSQQRYDLEMQRLQQINAIEQNLLQQHMSLREQITLTGMGDDKQAKLNFFYEKLASLREGLSRATDEGQVQIIDQQMQQYIQQALGVAGDNAENRSKLMQILDDMDGLVGSRLGTIKGDMANRDLEVANLLEKAANMLMKAAGDLSGDPPGTLPGDDLPPSGGGVGEDPGHPPLNPVDPIGNNSIGSATAMMLTPAEFFASLQRAQSPAVDTTLAALERLRVDVVAAVRGEAASSGGSQDVYRRADVYRQAEWMKATADAVREALAGVTVRGAINEGDAVLDVDTQQLMLASRDFTVQFIKRNPGSIQTRNG